MSNKMTNLPKISPKFALLGAFAVGVILTLFFVQAYYFLIEREDNVFAVDGEQIRTEGQRFTSPLLECSDIRPLRVDLFSRLEQKLTESIPDDSDENGVEMSLYLRDLTNGGWLDIGSKELYQPASLMKLPTLIAAYKKYDTTPEYFAEQMEATIPFGKQATQNIVDGTPLDIGDKVTVIDLVQRTILFSDNLAHDNLANKVGIVLIESVLEDFGIPPITKVLDYKISPRIYARFLRILYNSTYLSQKSSEELLELLTKSKFDKGIRAGVPKNVAVASKFGERVMKVNGSEVYQLHDCGIVYTKRPYILCVMTKGPSFESLYEKISNVSKTIYDVMQ